MKTQRRRSAWMLGGAGTLAFVLLAACNLDASGVQPPPGKLAYPIAVALSKEPTPRTLFVANSNFDLTYSAGSVQAYDLTLLDRQFEQCRTVNQSSGDVDGGSIELPDFTTRIDGGGALDAALDAGDAGVALAEAGLSDGALPEVSDAAAFDASPSGLDGALAGPIVLPSNYGTSPLGPYPEGALCNDRNEGEFEKRGCCLQAGVSKRVGAAVSLDEARSADVSIDSFATGLAVSPDNRRLYVPISSRSRLVYLDIEEGRLGCGAETGRCTRGPGRGRADEVPDQDYPGQPSTIAVGTLADLGIAAQALGKPPATPFVVTAHERGGLSLYVESAATELGVRPESEPILESVHENALAAPTSVTVDGRNRLLYVTRAGRSSSISRFGVRVAAEGDHSRQGALREPGPRELLYPTSDITVSGVAVGQDLRDVALDPLDPTRLFVLTRLSPQALLFMRLDPTAPLRARVTDVVRVGSGPSKLEYTVLDGRPFLLVSSYDARAIYVIDPNIRELVAEIRNLSGPYDMAVDTARRLLYVADFRTSVVRVVDLAGLVDKTKPRPGIIATIGALTFKGSLQ